MKKILLFTTTLAVISVSTNAQTFKGILNRMKKDSSLNSVLQKVPSTTTAASLSTTDIIAGLQEALKVGAERSTAKLSATDGFFKNAALKILIPAEAQKVEQKLRALGMGKQVDNAILAMNRGAEDAIKQATTIFINSIKQMTFSDATGILRGGDSAATLYLKSKTTAELTNAFRPVIEQSLAKVGATKHWNTLFSTYNSFSSNKVNTDLSAYVTEKALTGIFQQLSVEEQQIRKNPVARTSEILKKVFGR